MNTVTNYADLFYLESANNDVTALEKNVEDNPASAIARFLLLYHYKKNNDSDFEKFANQSSLYFNNPYWLQLQLLQTDLKKEESNFLNPASSEEDGHFAVTFPEDKNELKEEIIPFESGENRERLQPVDSIESPTSNKEEILAFEPKEEMLETDQLNNDAPFENIKEEPLAFEPKKEILETAQPLELINNNLPAEETKEEIIPFEPDENRERLQPVDNIEPLINNQTEEDTIAFEPLHTVDYFASQGIKIKEEALMNDKLGKQMKSFTDWLKSMKKLHPGKLPEQNEVIEKIIQSSAEESNADAQVLTEAMAEVLIKQDKKEKAIEMYQKLSLMNPSKSAYFAAKIESIKTN